MNKTDSLRRNQIDLKLRELNLKDNRPIRKLRRKLIKIELSRKESHKKRLIVSKLREPN